jgi:hypothetical protein
MAQLQRDSYEALAENFAAAQRRTMGLAKGGFEFMRLQEQNARATQEFFAGSVRLLQLQQRNAEFVQGWTGNAVEALREQTEDNVKTAEAFARGVSKHQEVFGTLSSSWTETYRDLFSPLAYVREGVRTTQRVAQQGLKASEQVARQSLRVAQEATEQTEEVLKQAEKATKKAELRSAVFGALGTTNYEELTVEEVSRRIEGLRSADLKKVREYEKKNKNRETLIEQIARKISVKNS